jgi:pimeloyl-ACP methyl ester carboxylesterase
MSGLRVRLATAALLVVGVLLIDACGGAGGSTHGVTDAEGAAPAPRADGLVDVHTITYRSSFDGSRVTGLAAVPRAVPSRGCIIWQFGFGSKKEDSSRVWPSFASLGLTTFSIDFRDHGARASSVAETERVPKDPKLLAQVIRGTVGDLHSAVDYLEKQPYCRQNVAYGGVSLGGAIGTILAATDKRVKAAVLVVTPGSWREVVTAPGVGLFPGVARHPAKLAAALRLLSPLDPARFVGRISPRPVLILSGVQDTTVLMPNSRLLQAAARGPKTIMDFTGGHDPTLGAAGASNAQAITSFLLRHLVEPTYGISGNANGTFVMQQ